MTVGRAVVPSCRRAVVPSCRRAVRACSTSLVRWMALQCAKRTARRVVYIEHIEVFFLVISLETPETGHVGFPEKWVI